MSTIDTLLRCLGARRQYICDWGVYETRYSSLDFFMERPIHKHMSVAPPWAKFNLRRVTQRRAA